MAVRLTLVPASYGHLQREAGVRRQRCCYFAPDPQVTAQSSPRDLSVPRPSQVPVLRLVAQFGRVEDEPARLGCRWCRIVGSSYMGSVCRTLSYAGDTSHSSVEPAAQRPWVDWAFSLAQGACDRPPWLPLGAEQGTRHGLRRLNLCRTGNVVEEDTQVPPRTQELSAVNDQ